MPEQIPFFPLRWQLQSSKVFFMSSSIYGFLWPALEGNCSVGVYYFSLFGFGIAGNYDLSENSNPERVTRSQASKKSARNNCKLLNVCIKLNENCSTLVAPLNQGDECIVGQKRGGLLRSWLVKIKKNKKKKSAFLTRIV